MVTRHIKGLDVLRAFAVFLVIIAHWGPRGFRSTLPNFVISKIVPAGTFGVDLFFVLSGFLITNILLVARNETSPENRLQIVKSFYIRRMLRIFPIYFFLTFALAYLLNYSYVKDHILYYVTYTSNFLTFKVNNWEGFSHTWSLAVEEQFYIIWPWIIIYSPKKHLLAIILFSIAIGLVGTLALNYQFGQFSAVLLLPCITAFAIGGLYAYVITNKPFEKVVIKMFLYLLPVCLVLLFIDQLGFKLVLIRCINSIIAINVIIYIYNQKYNFITSRILNNKFLIYTGKISYGIYLYHYMLPNYWVEFINYIKSKIYISDKALKILTVPPTDYLIRLIILFLISALSYKYIELNFLRFKKYFTYVKTTNKQLVASNK